MVAFLPANRRYRHLLFWTITAVYFWLPQWIYPDYIDTVTHYYFGFDYQHSPWFLSILFLYVFGMGVVYAYSFLRWVVPPLLSGRYAVGVGRYLLITVGVCYLARLLKGLHLAVLDPFLQGRPLRSFDGRHFDGYFFNQVYIHEYSTIILVLAAYKFFANWLQKEQETNRLAREKISTEIDLLKTQINPDFLLNTLANLHQLTGQKSPESPQVVLRLAQLMRYLLYESQADEVPLAREIEMMQHYIFLTECHAKNTVDIALNVSGDGSGLTIAPLLLLPLLESAVCHHTDSEQAWASMQLVVVDNALKFTILTGQGADETPSVGSLDKRLKNLYPGRFTLTIMPSDNIRLLKLDLILSQSSVSPVTFQSRDSD